MTGLPNDREEVWRAFLWANTLIMRRFRTDLRASGLSVEEFDVLIHLYRAPGKTLTLSDLAGSLVLGDVLTRSGLTRLLDRMERDGVLRRRLNRADRRRFDVHLTAAGVRRFEKIWPGHQSGIENYFSDPLDDHDIRTLGAALTKLVSANRDA